MNAGLCDDTDSIVNSERMFKGVMVNLQMESLQQMKVKLTNAYNKEPTNTYSSAYRMKRTILLRVNKYCHSSKIGQIMTDKYQGPFTK